jgi:cell division protein FtsB
MSRAESKSPVTRRHGRRTLQYLLIFIGWVLVVDAFVGEKGLSAMIQARRQYRALDESLAVARSENARLREEARRLREDPATIEEFARRELGLIRPGEKLFIIRDAPASDPR